MREKNREGIVLDLPFAEGSFSLQSPSVPTRHVLTPDASFYALCGDCVMFGIDTSRLVRLAGLPEGRHLRAKLAGTDVFACAELSGWTHRPEFESAFLQVGEAVTPEESVIGSAGLLMLEPGVKALEPLTPDIVQYWYDAIVEGLEVRGPARSKLQEEDDARRRRAIVAKACALDGILPAEGRELPPIVRALAAFDLFQTLRPFPAVNLFVGRLVYAHILASNRMGFATLVPVADFMRRWRAGATETPGFAVGTPFAQALARREDGALDWTEYYRVLIRYLLNELRWLGRKADGMLARRVRLEAIAEACPCLNERQKKIVVEALVHDDAEFTIKDHQRACGIAYSTAHDDLVELARLGLLAQGREGKELFFIPSDRPWEHACAYFREQAGSTFDRFYDENGRLRKGATQGKAALSRFDDEGAFWNPGSWPRFAPARRHAIFSRPLGDESATFFEDALRTT